VNTKPKVSVKLATKPIVEELKLAKTESQMSANPYHFDSSFEQDQEDPEQFRKRMMAFVHRGESSKVFQGFAKDLERSLSKQLKAKMAEHKALTEAKTGFAKRKTRKLDRAANTFQAEGIFDPTLSRSSPKTTLDVSPKRSSSRGLKRALPDPSGSKGSYYGLKTRPG